MTISLHVIAYVKKTNKRSDLITIHFLKSDLIYFKLQGVIRLKKSNHKSLWSFLFECLKINETYILKLEVHISLIIHIIFHINQKKKKKDSY